jgi:hypothetical protein
MTGLLRGLAEATRDEYWADLGRADLGSVAVLFYTCRVSFRHTSPTIFRILFFGEVFFSLHVRHPANV